MANLFAHYKENTGEVIGILNQEKYKRIAMPSPNVPITQFQADKIVTNPSLFKVENKKLVESKQLEGIKSIDAELAKLKRESHNLRIVGFVDSDKVCYMSDDVAITHLSFSILASQYNSKVKPKVHCMIDGKRCLKEISTDKAKKVIEELYNIRVKADQMYFDGYNKLLELQ